MAAQIFSIGSWDHDGASIIGLAIDRGRAVAYDGMIVTGDISGCGVLEYLDLVSAKVSSSP